MNFNQLPSRKQMNLKKFNELVEILAEYKQGGHVVIGEIYRSMYLDLSATKQEKWNAILKATIEDVRGKR